MKIVKHFKSEIIKVLVFLLLFFSSLIYVLIEKDNHYKPVHKKEFISKDTTKTVTN